MRSSLDPDVDTSGLARVLADPTRSAMLWALSDGRALPAGELARVGRVTAATASSHLAKLLAADLVRVEKFGRHRCFRLANPDIVRVLEALAALAPRAHSDHGTTPSRTSGIRFARTCYDHLAGRVGVCIAEALLDRRHIEETEGGYAVTRSGDAWFGSVGISIADLRSHTSSRRAFARACLDWSERQYHVAGALGAALCTRLLDIEWFERLPATRALRLTNTGRRQLRRRLEITLF
jgi:DNA-binding transcriptional ArsR family regulator